MLTFLLESYLKSLKDSPAITTSISVAFLVGLGDLLSQQVIEKLGWAKHNIFRSLKMITLGGLVAAPFIRNWFMTLDYLYPGDSFFVTLKKVVTDQVCFAPFINGLMFILSDKIDGKSNEEVKKNLSTNYISAMKVNYMLWPAVQLVNFSLIPANLRVIFVNFIAIFWNCYLAFMMNRKSPVKPIVMQ